MKEGVGSGEEGVEESGEGGVSTQNTSPKMFKGGLTCSKSIFIF